MTRERIYLKVDLPSWVEGTIEKYESGEAWNPAWKRTYVELGGESEESGKKGCPMAAAKTLYKLGRIKGHGPIRMLPLNRVVDEHSKNGAYAIAGIECLEEDPTLNLNELWASIRQKILSQTGAEPAISNQGGPTLTFKLWKLGMLR